MKQYAFGVDIGGTTIKLGLFDKGGGLLKKQEITTRLEQNGQFILSDIAAALTGLMEQRSLTLEDILGVGVGVPGPVLRESVVNRCVNLGWGVVDVADTLRRLSGIERVAVGNDANVAALGELRLGGGRGFDSIVMVTLGTGVGGGVVQQGRIVSGAFGAGGEIGHLLINPAETEPCGCGKYGHLEQYASATGIVRQAKKRLAQSDQASCLRTCEPLTSKAVFDAAKLGDPLALDIVGSVGDSLGAALASISCVMDPEAYVIGGGVSQAGSILLDAVSRRYRHYAFHASEHTQFRLAELGNDAGIYGAAQLVLPPAPHV